MSDGYQKISRRMLGGISLGLMSGTMAHGAAVRPMSVDQALASLNGEQLGRLISRGAQETQWQTWGMWWNRASSMSLMLMPVARQVIQLDGHDVTLERLRIFVGSGALFDAMLDVRVDPDLRANLTHCCSVLPGFQPGVSRQEIHPDAWSQNEHLSMMITDVLNLLRSEDQDLPQQILRQEVDWLRLRQMSA